MKVFSIKKYLEDMKKRKDTPGSWTNGCDGREVEEGKIKGTPYLADDDWCIDTEEGESNMEKKYTMAEFEKMFDEAVEKTLVSWEIAGEMAKLMTDDDVAKEKIEMYASLSLDQNKGVLDGLKTILFGDADEHK